jgi:glycine cleavage system H protein
MKELRELVFPDDLRYAEDHEWVRPGDVFRIGISDYAQDQLGDITFVEFPEVGVAFKAGDEVGTLESTKAVSELYLPVGGEIVAVNEVLDDTPGLINSDPYGEGWILEIRPSDPADVNGLMDKDTYVEVLKGLD